METTKIEVDIFDPHSLKNAIKELKAYKKRIDQKANLLAEALAEAGYREIKVWIDVLGAVDTQNLKNSLFLNKRENKSKGNHVYYVLCDSEYACFVEFGTGSKGKLAQYPYEFPRGAKRWKYDVGATIKEGKNGWRGWFYPVDEAGTEWRWTEGQASRPFMSNGFREMVSEVESIAKEIFG